MNKTDLINSIASKSGLNKKNSEAALNAFIGSVEDSLKGGDKVVLVGFGTFETKVRAARQGINPRTKATIEIPASKVPAFKISKALKDKVAGK
jgi:DNA-binding protein HU-beta